MLEIVMGAISELMFTASGVAILLFIIGGDIDWV